MLNYYCELWDYIFEPLNDVRKFKFLDVVSKVSWNKVCDLWCWYSWLFWALWYFQRVDEIYFYEYYDVYIDKLNYFINNISPEFLEENFWEVIFFLQKNNLIDKNKSFVDIASELLEKIICVEKINFLEKIPWENFDVIFTNESIECVESNNNFSKILNNIYSWLCAWWKLIFIMLGYDKKNNITEELIKFKLEWNLNIEEDNINWLLLNSWFISNSLQMIIFKELWNRWKYLYWEYIKK